MEVSQWDLMVQLYVSQLRLKAAPLVLENQPQTVPEGLRFNSQTVFPFSFAVEMQRTRSPLKEIY